MYCDFVALLWSFIFLNIIFRKFEYEERTKFAVSICLFSTRQILNKVAKFHIG
jgi:hypothetical protein